MPAAGSQRVTGFGCSFRPFGRHVALAVAGVWLMATSCSDGRAQSEPLFEPLPSNQIADATPEQANQVARLRQAPTTASIHLVRVNLDALHKSAATIALADGRSVQAVRRSMVTRGDQDFTWTGELPDAAGNATLVVREGNVTGTVKRDNELYRVVPIGKGVHAVVKVDQSKFPPEHPTGSRGTERRGDPSPRR